MVVLALTAVTAVTASAAVRFGLARRRRAIERERIEQQLEYILAIPSADYRLRRLERLVG